MSDRRWYSELPTTTTFSNQQRTKIEQNPIPVKPPKKHAKQTQQTPYRAKRVFYCETGTVGIIEFDTIKKNIRVNNHSVDWSLRERCTHKN